MSQCTTVAMLFCDRDCMRVLILVSRYVFPFSFSRVSRRSSRTGSVWFVPIGGADVGGSSTPLGDPGAEAGPRRQTT